MNKWLKKWLLIFCAIIMVVILPPKVVAAKYHPALPAKYQGFWYAYAGEKTFRHHPGSLFNLYRFTNHNSAIMTEFIPWHSSDKTYTISTQMQPVVYKKVFNKRTRQVSYLQRNRLETKLRLRRTKIKVAKRQRVALVLQSGKLKLYLFRSPLATHNIIKAIQKAYY